MSVLLHGLKESFDMRKLLLTLGIILASYNLSFSTHISGGDIQYEYIGDSTGKPHHYRVFLRLYRRTNCPTGPCATLGPTTNVYVNSGCIGSRITVPMTLKQGSGQIDQTLFDCVDQVNVEMILEQYEYTGEVELPQKCSDWVFYWSSCCRPGGITNGGSNEGFYFEAKLNNNYGNNSSPYFVSAPATAFCVNQSYNFKQSVLESDGDSIHFSLIGCRETNATTWIPLVAPYTFQQPITTSPPQSLYLDPKTGNIAFTPSAVEVDILAVLVNEFRRDTNYGVWVNVGSSNRDMMVQIAATCSQEAMEGVKLDFTLPDIYPDPVNGLPTVDYNCLDSAVTLTFTNKLDCRSISSDGTDFRLTSPLGQPIPIKELIPFCDFNNETKKIIVKLHKPLSSNGKYWLYSKIGNDANTLLNKCGFAMSELDTIQLNVKGCFQLQMDLKNVTIVDDMNPKVEWLADTATFPTYLFDKYKIFRQDPGGPYQHVGDVFDPLKMEYTDPQVDWVGVDLNSYNYKVEMVLNNQDMGKTRDVKSILLEGAFPTGTCDSAMLKWSNYNGWGSPMYEVQIGTPDGSGGYTWAAHSNPNSPANPTSDTTYLVIADNFALGNYKIRVQTVDPSGLYTALSNWIDCNVPTPPIAIPDTTWVPNIFTPDGDGVNDYFEIFNVHQYKTRRIVQIYNRWGKSIFKSDMYTNEIGKVWDGTDSNGNKLADGVYFYYVDLYDEASGKSFIEKGSVTLMGNR